MVFCIFGMSGIPSVISNEDINYNVLKFSSATFIVCVLRITLILCVVLSL